MVGLTENFSFGMSYGIQNFIGEEKPQTNKETPELQIKYRVFEETESTPAFLMGLDTQGFGPYISTAEYTRYIMGDGEIGLRLTDKGREYAEMLEIKELAKEDMGVEKYRKSENRRQPGWG